MELFGWMHRAGLLAMAREGGFQAAACAAYEAGDVLSAALVEVGAGAHG